MSVSVTEEIAADLRTVSEPTASGSPTAGIRSRRRCGCRQSGRSEGRRSKVRLVYTGRLGAGTARRSPEGLFRALERLAESDPSLSAKLELVVAGPRTTTDAELLAPGERRGTVVPTSVSSRGAEASGLQRTADVLVLVGSGGSEAPGKLFEYLGAERPILHLGGAGAAARILAETGGGVTVGHEDVEAIVEQLRLSRPALRPGACAGRAGALFLSARCRADGVRDRGSDPPASAPMAELPAPERRLGRTGRPGAGDRRADERARSLPRVARGQSYPGRPADRRRSERRRSPRRCSRAACEGTMSILRLRSRPG